MNLPKTVCRNVDVTDRSSFERAIEEAEGLFAHVDCLINNAGVMLRGNIEKQDASEWEKMFAVNVLGLLHDMQIVLDKMKNNLSGTIINVSSLAGRKIFEHHAAYFVVNLQYTALLKPFAGKWLLTT